MGKSEIAVHIALKFRGEIINCDSIQVYRHFDIGTDKPPRKIRKAVPHHLIDIVDPQVQFTAADFAREAPVIAEDILSRERLPLVVGGTGLYIKSLVDGLFPGPGRNPGLREELEAEIQEKGLDTLHRRLEEIDPLYAKKIRSRDRMRIVRALEVYSATGQPISEHFRNTKSPLSDLHILKIGLFRDREDLYRRIENRVDRMFDLGLIDEVRNILGMGIPPTAPPFRALGYRHVLDHLHGDLPLEEAKSLTKRDTRHYAKRQMTWFRKMEDVSWFSPEDGKGLEEHLQNHISLNYSQKIP